MKKIFFLILITFIIMQTYAQEKETVVLLETKEGNVKIKLYNDTPLHRDNFVKLVKEGFYNDLLFHRVIKDFMIQGGDPDSKNASESAMLGGGGLPYTIPAEIMMDKHYHKKGALAAARQGDEVNPEKASSSTQFYIVTGIKYTPPMLETENKKRMDKAKSELFRKKQKENNDTIKALYKEGNRQQLQDFKIQMIAQAEAEANSMENKIYMTPEQKEAYQTIGGTPFLDGGYTVFGEVIEGLDMIDKIQNVPTGRGDRPKENITMKISILEE